ncbi:hypothetical protein JTE90_016260 [Oedothorax gibbosus]|uniref:Uncharacterized protein n=1 Tax=Oedothorax gibbosus TaxID=931172 RepID=A0AAV6VR09_9ARAC|nr:hypothetical protein JTE90_016260 [Oedothorax gibbosus]
MYLRYLPIVISVWGHYYFVGTQLSKHLLGQCSRSRLSDYESINNSPVSSENNNLMAKSLAVQTMDKVNRCSMCRAKTRHGVGVEPQSLRSPKKD